MRRWFYGLPVHRKLTVLAVAIASVALLVALGGLLAADLWRARAAAEDEATSLAHVLAENVAASVVFDDPAATRDLLASLRVRSTVVRGCVYLTNGRLFSGYSRPGAAPCDADRSSSPVDGVVSMAAPIVRNNRTVGRVVLDRDLSDLNRRIALVVVAGLVMMAIAAVVAFFLAARLQRVISRPIVELALAARSLGQGGAVVLPVETPPDEIGELVRTFGAMAERIQQTTATLVESNAALQIEVDERRRVEVEREALLVREREASRLKDEFLAAVSHELRTPLNAIVGWSSVLQSAPPDPARLAQGLASISRNAQAQTRVIEDLLDISRIATGKLRMAMTEVDLAAVVEGALDAVRPGAVAKGIAVRLETPGAPVTVAGDPERLQQIVWNLLSNAIKFTPAGGAVRVSLTSDGDAGLIQVADSGVGISPEFLPHVFERFRQADGSLARAHGGLGLGLAIVRELAEVHGGSASAASEGQGRGAQFTVRLPQVRRVRRVGAAETRLAPALSLRGVRVLAVDDNADSLEILVEALTSAGASVSVARSGREAGELWRAGEVNVLVCDLAMPGVDGFEVLRRIRERDAAAGRFTPALAVTAHASEEQRSRSARAGFQAHLSKPYVPAQLVEAVAAAAERA